MTADKLTTFDVLIEIPRGSRNKYEYDFEIKRMRFDRMLFSSGTLWIYPRNISFRRRSTRRFGFSNRAYVSWLCDGSKANWCFHMADDKGPDEK
jgi:inorganic pyrophosphatase